VVAVFLLFSGLIQIEYNGWLGKILNPVIHWFMVLIGGGFVLAIVGYILWTIWRLYKAFYP
jgi:hypothetical protein